jgi:hypothetical protein
MPALLCLALLLLSGCHGMMVDSLNQRHIQSCVWWQSGITGLRSVSATGGVDIQTCLTTPCQGR